MFSDAEVDQIRGAVVFDRTGHRIGDVDHVFLDDSTGDPMWVSVNTGLFGLHTSLAPLAGAHLEHHGHLVLAHDKDVVKDAPRVDQHGHLDRAQEDELYAYYGIDDPHEELAAERRRTRRWINEGGPLLPGD